MNNKKLIQYLQYIKHLSPSSVCMINTAKMSHGGLNMFFLSAGSDSGLHCVLLNSEHAIPDLSPHP